MGPQGTVFYAHGDLLAHISPVLAADVNGKMQEAVTKTIVIKDVDGDIDDDTVSCFIEFLYRNDYNIPGPIDPNISTKEPEGLGAHKGSSHADKNPVQNLWHENSTNDSVEHSSKTVGVAWDHGMRAVERRRKQKQMKSDGTWEFGLTQQMIDEGLGSPAGVEPEQGSDQDAHPFLLIPFLPGPLPVELRMTDRHRIWEGIRSVSPGRYQREIIPTNDKGQDFTDVFLCHACLYKFSERYQIPGLMNLALRKLRLTLANYVFRQSQAAAVIELIRYAYTHTMDYEKGRDKLRSLVLDYAVCYIHQLEREQSFTHLLREGGHLPSDLITRMASLLP